MFWKLQFLLPDVSANLIQLTSYFVIRQVGWLPWKKKLPVFCFDARQPVSVRLQTWAFLMSTCLFPNSLEYQFLLWYCFTCLLRPGYRGVSLTNAPATNLLSPLVAFTNIWTTVCKAVTPSVSMMWAWNVFELVSRWVTGTNGRRQYEGKLSK